MKAITICQPFAHLICLPESDPRCKRVENRSQRWGYRGEIAIHAGKGHSHMAACEEFEVFAGGLVFGAVVAVAELVECFCVETVSVKEALELCTRFRWLGTHKHVEGPWCLVLQNVRVLATPIPAKGALGLWEWDAPSLEFVEAGKVVGTGGQATSGTQRPGQVGE